MKKLLCFAICILVMLQMVACGDTVAAESSSAAESFTDSLGTTTPILESEPTETSPTVGAEPKIVVGETAFTVDEINKQLRQAMSVMVYFSGANKLSEFLDSPFYNYWNASLVDFIEYDLYYRPYQETSPFITPAVILYERNIKPQENSGRIGWGFTLTKQGIQSYVSYHGGDLDPSYYVETYGDSYIGRYTMDLGNVTKPTFETVTEDWTDSVRSEVCLYMDENVYDMPKGKYQIYVKGFWESDTDSEIFFEYENGDVYHGSYNFVHYPQKDTIANVDHVEPQDYTAVELEHYKETAAFYMEYEV